MDLGLDLFSGSWFERGLARIHLKAETPAQALLRGLVLGGLAWLPMAIWSVASANMYSAEPKLSFFYDFAAHAQFLIGIPMMCLGQAVISRKISRCVSYLGVSGLVSEGDRNKYQKIIRTSENLANSNLMEILWLPLAYMTFASWFIGELSNGRSTWHALAVNGIDHITFAGLWEGVFAMPLWWFLIYRWIWRIFIWYMTLYKTTRLGLRLRASHPDRMAGLAMVSEVQSAFGILIFIFGCVIASTALYKVMIEGDAPSSINVWSMVVAYVILSPAAFLAPMLVFTPHLIRLKNESRFRQGLLGSIYARQFEQKWLYCDNPVDGDPLGSGDIQSLADLGNAYDRISALKIIPFDMKNIIRLFSAALGPMIPIITKFLSMNDSLKKIFEFLSR
jgi:hypothetical protein